MLALIKLSGARCNLLHLLGTWISQHEHRLFLILCNTGARVSEIATVKVGDVVVLDAGADDKIVFYTLLMNNSSRTA